MSAPTTTDQPDRPSPNRMGSKLMKGLAALVAVAALAFGATAITKADSSSTAGGAVQNAPAGAGAPAGAPPGMGTAVTGATLSRLEDAATARYPGTVERAMQLPDGSYVVHVIRSDGDGEVHVLVSKDFKVTGVEQGGPPGGAPPSDQTAPSGSGTSAARSS